ncbi:stage III sporulation protein AG [Paenibacillus marinisediminis]
MAKWLQQIESLLGKGSNGTNKIKTFRWLLLLGLIGAALVLMSSLNVFGGTSNWLKGNDGREPPAVGAFQTQGEAEPDKQVAANSFESIENSFEARVRDILEDIIGVGQVDVMVTIDSTEELVIQRNMKDSQQTTEEKDANGGTRHITQFTRDGEIVMLESSGDNTPIVTKRIKPKVRGVVVVAGGAENKVVKQIITDAVEKGLNVPSYRISVVPRKIVE